VNGERRGDSSKSLRVFAELRQHLGDVAQSLERLAEVCVYLGGPRDGGMLWAADRMRRERSPFAPVDARFREAPVLAVEASLTSTALGEAGQRGDPSGRDGIGVRPRARAIE
jgi:hypothetical protein